MTHPTKAFSWEVLTADVAVKHMDKSSFLHHGTGIPREITFFFDLNSEGNLQGPRPVVLVHAAKQYNAHFQMDALHSRFRLFWKADMTALIQSRFPATHRAFASGQNEVDDPPLMRFQKLSTQEYMIDFVESVAMQADLQALGEEARLEGGTREYRSTKYERDPKNRQMAVAYHGTRCCVCGFSFEEVYGTRGQGYIEVHHVTPLSSLEAEVVVDPRTDLVPVCANCHRMIHRYKDDVLTIPILRDLVRAAEPRPISLTCPDGG